MKGHDLDATLFGRPLKYWMEIQVVLDKFGVKDPDHLAYMLRQLGASWVSEDKTTDVDR